MVIIRLATNEDLPQICDLWYTMLLDHGEYEVYYEPSYDSKEQFRSMLNWALTTKDRFLFISEKNQEIIGFLYGILRSIPPVFKKGIEAHVSDIVVKEEFRSMGYGRKLVNHFKGFAEKEGANVMSLNVHIKNTRAIDFYEKTGWEKQMIVMRKDITPQDDDIHI